MFSYEMVTGGHKVRQERLGKMKLIILTSPRDERASSLCTATWGMPERSGGRRWEEEAHTQATVFTEVSVQKASQDRCII